MTRVLLLLALVAVAVSARGIHKRHGRPPCGLPRFAEKITGEKKTEIEEIWKDYKDGEDCDDEQDKTKEFIHGLTDEERKTVFGDKHRGPHGGGPHFLKGVADDVREQFTALWKDHSMSRDDKHKKFHDLAQKVLTGKNLEEYGKFEKHMEERKAEWDKKVAALSPAAKTVFDKLEELREQKRKVMAEADAEVRKELDELFSRHFHHGHHGRFGGKH